MFVNKLINLYRKLIFIFFDLLFIHFNPNKEHFEKYLYFTFLTIYNLIINGEKTAAKSHETSWYSSVFYWEIQMRFQYFLFIVLNINIIYTCVANVCAANSE